MASINEQLRDILLTHAARRLKYGDHLANETVKLLNAVEKRLVEQIAQRLANIEERGYDLGPATTERLNETLRQIAALNTEVYSGVSTFLMTELTALAAAEAAYASGALERVFKPINYIAHVPTPARLEAIVTAVPSKGKLLKTWFAEMERKQIDGIDAAIREGMASGRTLDQIIRDIRGTKAEKYANGITGKSRKWVSSVVRTSVNHVSNQAAMMSWEENPRVVSRYQWNSTLDNNTTPICTSLDLKVFEIGKGPMPPAHINCRSTIVPITKSWREMGIDRDDIDEDTRASMDGQVPASMSRREWIMSKSIPQQEHILGKRRAQLLREGKVSWDDIFRPNGTYVPLSELYNDPDA